MPIAHRPNSQLSDARAGMMHLQLPFMRACAIDPVNGAAALFARLATAGKGVPIWMALVGIALIVGLLIITGRFGGMRRD